MLKVNPQEDRSKKARSHFKKVDPVLFNACKKVGFFDLKSHIEPTGYFEQLCREIVGQQLSGKAADTIWGRFISLMPDKLVTPQNVLGIKDEASRGSGMSGAKTRYVKDLAQCVSQGDLDLEKLKDLENSEVIKELVKVKGIGPWTAEMFLMFTLSREDVFSLGDLGLKNAIKKLYSLENPTTARFEELSKKWSPYRTYACRVLWKSLEV